MSRSKNEKLADLDSQIKSLIEIYNVLSKEYNADTRMALAYRGKFEFQTGEFEFGPVDFETPGIPEKEYWFPSKTCW